jgi:hypothetical protein
MLLNGGVSEVAGFLRFVRQIPVNLLWLESYARRRLARCKSPPGRPE